MDLNDLHTVHSARVQIVLAPPCIRRAFFLGMILCSACGSDGLSGSISKHVDLHYSSLQLTLTEGASAGLEVNYTNAQGGSVVDILVDSNAADLGDLLQIEGQDFLDRVHLARSANLVGSFPAVHSGAFRLSKHNFDIARAAAAGSFEFVFAEGSGLEGGFDGAPAVVFHF